MVRLAGTGKNFGVSLQVVVDFQVVDECPDWIVVDKPAPLIVHPANRKSEPTLLGGVEMLLAYEMENGAAPAVVTRLDRETSGLVVLAKHPQAARELGIAFQERRVEKQYLAVVSGWPAEDEWECDASIGRAGDFGPSDIWVKQIPLAEGRPCLTRFRVERRFERTEGRFALVRCFPVTGRMHQLRVHLKHCGHPIVGDKLYSRNGEEYLEWMRTGWTPELADRLILPRHGLHAAGLIVPWRDRELRWTSPLAADLADFVAGREVLEGQGIVIWSRHG